MRHLEASGLVAAPPDEVFAHRDDQARFAAHMSRRSWMMGGGRMVYESDAGRGQPVGSHIRMSGSAFGIRIALDEVIAERSPPTRKVWRTVGETRLIVVGAYAMGFDLATAADATRVTVWIDYALPLPASAAGFRRWPPATRIGACSKWSATPSQRSARRPSARARSARG